jgi:pimeloyl-ACP methyl ester carboxylesterase
MDRQTEEKIASAAFFPRPDSPFGPEAEGAFDHFFEVDSGVRLRLRVFWGEKEAPTILFFHGNGETARDYDFAADAYRGLPASLLVGEYRGYGPSSGRPSFETFLDDAHHTLDQVKKLLEDRGSTGKPVVMGRSLGSAPAIELASARPNDLAALIVESGFARTLPLLELVGVPATSLGLTEEFGPRNLEKMKQVSLPTLIMHAALDQLIPHDDAKLLAQACPDPKKVLYTVRGAGHNDIQLVAGKAYFEQIRLLLDRIA